MRLPPQPSDGPVASRPPPVTGRADRDPGTRVRHLAESRHHMLPALSGIRRQRTRSVAEVQSNKPEVITGERTIVIGRQGSVNDLARRLNPPARQAMSSAGRVRDRARTLLLDRPNGRQAHASAGRAPCAGSCCQAGAMSLWPAWSTSLPSPSWPDSPFPGFASVCCGSAALAGGAITLHRSARLRPARARPGLTGSLPPADQWHPLYPGRAHRGAGSPDQRWAGWRG